jgi:hypothetical protein
MCVILGMYLEILSLVAENLWILEQHFVKITVFWDIMSYTLVNTNISE